MSIPMVSWRDFIPQVQHAVAGCPMSSMVNAVREAAIEFCAESKVWTMDSMPTTILAGESSYSLDPPDNADLASVERVRLLGADLRPNSTFEWDEKRDESGAPRDYMVTEPLVVHLWPTPDATNPSAMKVKVALQPSSTSSQGPAFLLARYKEGIVAGALSKLMLIPDKTWTNPQLAAVNDAKFRNKINDTKIAVNKGGTTASLRVKRRKFI